MGKDNTKDAKDTKDPSPSRSPKKTNSSKSDSNNRLTLIVTNSIMLCIIAFLAHKLHVTQKTKTYADCGEYFSAGFREDGIYEIKPSIKSEQRVNVFCSMKTGGWTSLMARRVQAKSKAFVEWGVPIRGYQKGFGNIESDQFFLGLDTISLLTTSGKERKLKIVLNDSEYQYSHFRVLNEYYNYKLIVDEELDRMPDQTSFLRLNNTLFSAIDVDFDLAVNSNCSSGWKAGWWFTDCFDKSTCLTCLIAHGVTGVKNLNYAGMLIK